MNEYGQGTTLILSLFRSDKRCGACEGSGIAWDRERECPECFGTGRWFSDLGREVIEMFDAVKKARQELRDTIKPKEIV